MNSIKTKYLLQTKNIENVIHIKPLCLSQNQQQLNGQSIFYLNLVHILLSYPFIAERDWMSDEELSRQPLYLVYSGSLSLK